MPERGEVHRRPVLDQLALAHPEDVDELELDPVSSRRQIPEFTKVRPPKCLAGRNKIALSELLVDFHGGIRKPLQQRAVEGPEAARRPIRLRDSPTLRPVVIHELRMECLVSERQVVLILAPLYELSHHTLVVIGRHPPPPASGHKHASPPSPSPGLPPHPACSFTSDPHRNAEVARFLALRNGLLPTHSHRHA